MARSPKTVKVEIDWTRQEIVEALESARLEGQKEGFKQGLAEILNWLEAAYIQDEGRPDRGTTHAKAILEIARAAGRHLRQLQKSVRK